MVNLTELRNAVLTKASTKDEEFISISNKLSSINENDVYLKHARHIWDSTQPAVNPSDCSDIEELFFLFSVTPNPEKLIETHKKQINALLKKEQSQDLNVVNFILLIKKLNTLGASKIGGSLTKAFSTMYTSYIRKDTSKYKALLDGGYTSFDIAYLNASALTCNKDKKGFAHITLALTDLAFEVLNSPQPHKKELLDDLSDVFKFKIKQSRYSTATIFSILQHSSNVNITCADTFLWVAHEGYVNESWMGIDLLDSKFDIICKGLSKDNLLVLFSSWIQRNKDSDDCYFAERIQKRSDVLSLLINEYNYSYQNAVKVLVDRNIIQIKDCKDYIPNLIKSIPNKHAFEYCRMIKDSPELFCQSIVCSYGATFDIQRDFLSNEEHRELIEWVTNYIFAHHPNRYSQLIASLLMNETVIRVLTFEERQKIFDTIKHLHNNNRKLNSMYLSEEELLCISEKEKVMFEESVRGKFTGSQESLLNTLRFYAYKKEARPVLRAMLEENKKLLTIKFLEVSYVLINQCVITLEELKNYIEEIKTGNDRKNN